MSIYLELDAPEELCRHLFLSFVRGPSTSAPPAAGASNRYLSAGGGRGTSVDGGSVPHSLGFNSLPSSIHHGLSERLLHGLTEKLQSLGGGGTQPSSKHEIRNRTGSLGTCAHPDRAVNTPAASNNLASTCRVLVNRSSPPSASCSRQSSKKSNRSNSKQNNEGEECFVLFQDYFFFVPHLLPHWAKLGNVRHPIGCRFHFCSGHVIQQMRLYLHMGCSVGIRTPVILVRFQSSPNCTTASAGFFTR